MNPSAPTLRDLGEDALIQRLTQHLAQDSEVLIGPGDDCALVKASRSDLLLKVDALVQDVHFTLETDPRLIGRKALARAISDIGAMGGVPRHALVTLIAPTCTEVRFVEALYQGMNELAAQFGVRIVGGETSQGSQIVISVALTGDAPEGVVTRSGGLPGDSLFVTGQLGGSIKGRHLTFEPRVEQAYWLIACHRPSAMMDISDGLAKDLPRLATASELEFILDETALPCTEGCTPAQAWGDGEDYELLFAMPEADVQALAKDWVDHFPDLKLTRIGTLVAKGKGCRPNFATEGWEHFRKASC